MNIPNFNKEVREKIFDIVIVFADGHRERHEFSSIKIFEGCLIVVEPSNIIPCEVHCFPLTTIQSFIFDKDALNAFMGNAEAKNDINKS